MRAGWEIVRTDTGWHSRFVTANGRVVWWTENYRRHATAARAIQSLARWFNIPWFEVIAEIREVDERTTGVAS